MEVIQVKKTILFWVTGVPLHSFPGNNVLGYDHLITEEIYAQQGNSVARDLPPTGSEANTTIFVLYILDIDSHCLYLLSGETTFQLTSC